MTSHINIVVLCNPRDMFLLRVELGSDVNYWNIYREKKTIKLRSFNLKNSVLQKAIHQTWSPQLLPITNWAGAELTHSARQVN